MSSGTVVFMLSKFPCYDEAFILREIYALSKELDLEVLSLKHSKEKIIHDEAKALLNITDYVPSILSLKVIKANLQLIFSNPKRYFLTLNRLIAGNLKAPEFLIKNLFLFPAAVYLAQQFLTKGVEHIHAYWATYPASMALVISELTGIPFSFTGHAHDIYLNTTHLREKMQRAAFINTCTSQNKVYLVKLAGNVAEQKIHVNYHGLFLDQFSVQQKVTHEVFQILSVGSLQEHKGFEYLIDALKILKDKHIPFHCFIIGGGALQQDLIRHIKLLDLTGEISMTGPLKQAQILPYYKKADLFVLMAQPHWHWGIPNVLIEALAARTPVITTRFGSVEELIRDGFTGILVPPKDPHKLAGEIERLLSDEKERTRLAELGHNFVIENFDLKRNIKNFKHRLQRERYQDEQTIALVA